MKTKKKHIVRFTSERMQSMEREGKAGSDWQRAARVSLPDGSDPEDAMDSSNVNWVTTALPLRPRKTHASLRLDADVLEWFRAQGRGYQTKINAILRSYFEQHTR